MNRLFVYGTLRSPALRLALLGREVPARDARMEGLEVRAVDGETYPGAVPEPGATAVGDICRVSDDELAALDRFEEGYSRLKRTAVLADGTSVEASVYLWNDPERLSGPWNHDVFERDHLRSALADAERITQRSTSSANRTYREGA